MVLIKKAWRSSERRAFCVLERHHVFEPLHAVCEVIRTLLTVGRAVERRGRRPLAYVNGQELAEAAGRDDHRDGP